MLNCSAFLKIIFFPLKKVCLVSELYHLKILVHLELVRFFNKELNEIHFVINKSCINWHFYEI